MDDIHHLQTDNSEVSDKDKYVLNTIFNNKRVEKNYHIKQIIIMTLLYSILSLPALDVYIELIIKTNNQYYKLAFKTALFFSLYFLIINYVIKN